MDYIDNNKILKALLAIKSHSENVDKTYKIMNQIHFIHGLLLTKDKIKMLLRQKMN
jgi:hypothetical protein